MNLQDMTSTELAALKGKWYIEASEKISQLYSIARHLGTRVPHNYGPKYSFEKDALKIYVDDYGGYMTVHLNGKLIVSTHNERLYVPGEWEAAIPGLSSMAEEVKAEKDTQKEQKEKSQLLDELTAPEPKSSLLPIFEQILKPYRP